MAGRGSEGKAGAAVLLERVLWEPAVPLREGPACGTACRSVVVTWPLAASLALVGLDEGLIDFD